MLRYSKKMNKPEISVLMSVFNEQDYISESIQSVLNQSYENFELIIINDCSTDKTLEILESYTDPRINIFTNNRNIGQTKSLNIGLEKCRGRYIARLDGDDMMAEERLKKQFDYLVNNSHITVIGCYFHVVDENKNKIAKGHWPCGIENTFFYSICGKNPLGHPGVMMEKIAVSNVNNYSEDFLFSQDYDLWLRLLLNGYLIDNIPEYLTFYRDTANNSVEKKQKQELYHRKAFYNYVNVLTNKKIKSAFLDRYLNCLIFNNNNISTFMDSLFVMRTFNFLLSNIAIEIMVEIDKKIYNKMFIDDFNIQSRLLKFIYYTR